MPALHQEGELQPRYLKNSVLPVFWGLFQLWVRGMSLTQALVLCETEEGTEGNGLNSLITWRKYEKNRR